MINYSLDQIVDTIIQIKYHDFFFRETIIWRGEVQYIESVCIELIDKITVRSDRWLALVNNFFVLLCRKYHEEFQSKSHQIDLSNFPLVFFSPLILKKLRNVDYIKTLRYKDFERTAFELESIKQQQLLLPLNNFTDLSKLQLSEKINIDSFFNKTWFLKPQQFRYCFSNWRNLPNLEIIFNSVSGKEIKESLEHLDDNFCYHYTIENYQDINHLYEEPDKIRKLNLKFTFSDTNDLAFAKLQTEFFN